MHEPRPVQPDKQYSCDAQHEPAERNVRLGLRPGRERGVARPHCVHLRTHFARHFGHKYAKKSDSVLYIGWSRKVLRTSRLELGHPFLGRQVVAPRGDTRLDAEVGVSPRGGDMRDACGVVCAHKAQQSAQRALAALADVHRGVVMQQDVRLYAPHVLN